MGAGIDSQLSLLNERGCSLRLCVKIQKQLGYSSLFTLKSYKKIMDTITLIGIAVALAMDAFAVALATGLALPQMNGRHLFRLGFHFGLFQALMPVLGWLAGMSIQAWIADYAHWIAFALLVFVGSKMIHEAFADHDANDQGRDPTRGWSLVLLSVATSIDALAVGLTLAMLNVSVWVPSLVIGLVAGVLTVVGMLLGRRISGIWGKRVEVVGGLTLCGIGVKILLEHTLFQ
jgi:putative Mn2+ efflux pump MntP